VTFDQISLGMAVFLSASSLACHFTNDPKYGLASTRLVHRIELGVLSRFASTDVLAEIARAFIYSIYLYMIFLS
jgi:hypothetical protein